MVFCTRQAVSLQTHLFLSLHATPDDSAGCFAVIQLSCWQAREHPRCPLIPFCPSASPAVQLSMSDWWHQALLHPKKLRIAFAATGTVTDCRVQLWPKPHYRSTGLQGYWVTVTTLHICMSDWPIAHLFFSPALPFVIICSECILAPRYVLFGLLL